MRAMGNIIGAAEDLALICMLTQHIVGHAKQHRWVDIFDSAFESTLDLRLELMITSSVLEHCPPVVREGVMIWQLIPYAVDHVI
ncbi:hypothetical protein N7462_005342 [Penicillium macrosclerotiorum]|uniref:uncharacterized protein n=1 Tax=Penicillium macrosclerotiorum TaxID=303699 RepID=UPI00254959AA|nr:uncharacterized protein N7462_005342 [Penicillium macrosclerotiorum]KAJ5682177.1 hypothetical protein N7462_005342 [Penicillium macrosclerotiorum]